MEAFKGMGQTTITQHQPRKKVLNALNKNPVIKIKRNTARLLEQMINYINSIL
jgi:hypothetical protein